MPLNNRPLEFARGPSATPVGRALALTLACLTALSGCVRYSPTPLSEVPFLERAQEQSRGGITVRVAVLTEQETEEIFGTNLYRKGVQPVWVEVENGTEDPCYLVRTGMDPDYFPPGEAAYMSRYRTTGRVLRWGIWSLLFLPAIVVLLPVGIVDAWRARSANEAMAVDFRDSEYHPILCEPGKTASGFVFTALKPGTKEVPVVLFGPEKTKRFSFLVEVPGFNLDYHEVEIAELYEEDEIADVDEAGLREALHALPCCTTRKNGKGEGDPLNIVIVGEARNVIHAFTSARWDETESLGMGSAWRTFRAGVLGGQYRVSPMSDLYVLDRSQDIGLQKIRDSIHQRHHFRLWYLPLRFQGKPVWVGAASRDIGVYFTWRTWNLTTHAIDPDVDNARQYLAEDLLEAEWLSAVGSVGGVGASTPETPRRNLMNAPWYSDGNRLVMMVDEPPVRPRILDWKGDAVALEVDDEEVSGTVWIASQSISLGIGVTWGTGTLMFQGKRHRFALSGLSLLDLGVAAASASGNVYHLDDASDFGGTYAAIEAGIALGEGAGVLTARNENGVVIELRSDRRGAQLSLGPQGLRIKLKD